VLIPQEVYDEITFLEKPYSKKLREYFKSKIVKVQNTTALEILKDEIDAGEAEAIILALELGIKEILIDDFKGRKRAELKGLHVYGTFGLLIEAKKMKLIDNVKELLDELIENKIRIGKELYEHILRKAD
jgi:predicted nucleic acid-binding protein